MFVVVIAVIMGVTLSRTVSGRYTFAVGFNVTASKLAGIRVKAVQAGALLCSGLVGAIAGVVLAAHVSSATPAIGDSYLLPAFAAVFVGATQFSTKRFNTTGTVIAVFMLGTGEYGLLAAGAPQWTPDVFQGLALVAAIGLTHLYDPSRSTSRRAAKAPPITQAPVSGEAPLVAAYSGPAPAVPQSEQSRSPTEKQTPSIERQTPSIEISGLSKTFRANALSLTSTWKSGQAKFTHCSARTVSGSPLSKVLAASHARRRRVVRVSGEELPLGSPRDSWRMGFSSCTSRLASSRS